MIISDLSHLEFISETSAILGSAGVVVGVDAVAYGDSTSTFATAKTTATELPYGGSIAIGIARGSAIAFDPVDATANVNVGGLAEGQFTKVITQTYSVDTGPQAIAGGFIVAIAVDLPSRLYFN